MKKIFSKAISLLFCIVFSFSALSAEDMQFTQPFELDPLTDGIIAGTSGALGGSALLCDKVFHIKKNSHSGSYLDKNSINGFDRPFINNYSKALDKTADGVLALALVSPAIMFTNSNTDWLTVGVMYAETVALAYGLKQWGKMIIDRPRPYMYFEDYPQGEVDRGDWDCSFPSGHSTMAFTAAAFTSCVFNEYYPESPWRHVVTGVSFAAATTVGILRMCSGNHFFTDVLAGAAIGTICGFAVPFFHSQTFNDLINKDDKTEISVSPLGFSVAIKFD